MFWRLKIADLGSMRPLSVTGENVDHTVPTPRKMQLSELSSKEASGSVWTVLGMKDSLE